MAKARVCCWHSTHFIFLHRKESLMPCNIDTRVFVVVRMLQTCAANRRLQTLVMVSGLYLGLGAMAEPKADELSRSPWALQISGYTHHFKCTGRRAHPSWNNTNIGLGVQYDAWRRPASRWSTLVTAGIMKDSFGAHGAYTGVAPLYRLNDRRIETKLGGGLFLVYRSFDWNDKRQPALMLVPIFSVEDTRTGLGINITGSPSVNYGDKRIVSFVFVQGTFRF